MLDVVPKLVSGFPWMSFLLAAAIAVGGVLVLAPLARQTGWVDKPSARKAHDGHVPLVGGWAVVAAMLALQFLAAIKCIV